MYGLQISSRWGQPALMKQKTSGQGAELLIFGSTIHWNFTFDHLFPLMVRATYKTFGTLFDQLGYCRFNLTKGHCNQLTEKEEKSREL